MKSHCREQFPFTVYTLSKMDFVSLVLPLPTGKASAFGKRHPSESDWSETYGTELVTEWSFDSILVFSKLFTNSICISIYKQNQRNRRSTVAE